MTAAEFRHGLVVLVLLWLPLQSFSLAEAFQVGPAEVEVGFEEPDAKMIQAGITVGCRFK